MLTYASGPAIIEAPAHAAFQKGFFKEHGIVLDLKIYPDGKTALSSLLKGEVQLAGVMATPVVYESFRRNDFRIIAVVEHPKFHHLLVNKKRISSATDLKGKKVGVTFGTSGEYLMHSYLVSNEINFDEIEIYDLTGNEMVKAFINGNIDAMFSWNPYINEVKNQMGQQVNLLDDFQFVPPSWVIVGIQQFVEENPATIENFLRGLKKGIVFANENPEGLIVLHEKVSGKDKSYLVPSEIAGRFQLTLQQELLLDLEKQARWVISKTDTLKENMPDYLNLISLEAMQKVSPEVVTLIK